MSAEIVRHERTSIILFLTRHNESINDDKTTIFSHRPRVSLIRFSFCWCHNRLLMTSQWPDNCDAITWIVLSNSLDIDFVHGDIHGRSCKKIIMYILHCTWKVFLCDNTWPNCRSSIWYWIWIWIYPNLTIFSPLMTNQIINSITETMQWWYS